MFNCTKIHNKASISYLERKIIELKENIPKFELDILKLVVSVPIEIKNKLQDLILDYLIESDTAQREQELT